MIPKTVHFSWIDKTILKSDHVFPKNTIQRMMDLSPDWEFKLYTDKNIEEFLEKKLDKGDYNLIKDCHIVEKLDIWRLIKIYEEGGIYTDVDRLCNTPLNDIISNDVVCVLPTFLDTDFSQDFMCSAPNNPIFLETFKLVMQRRRSGNKNTYSLGPQTYMHGVTKALFGFMIETSAGPVVFNEIRKELSKHSFIRTYREDPPYNTVLYRLENERINFDHEEMKRNFYALSGLKHWTNEW
jgi:mannosyltransferase OCH1-like enzyme